MTLSKIEQDLASNIERFRTSHNKILRLSLTQKSENEQLESNHDIASRDLTLNEVASPTPFQFYDYVNIDDFSWRKGEDILELNVYASFLEEKASLDLIAYFIHSSSKQCIASVPLKSATMVHKLSSMNSISSLEHLAGTNMEEVTVIVDCQITDLLGRSTHLQMLADIDIKAPLSDIDKIDNFELAPVYTHIYPKKEDVTVVFGTDKGIKLPVTYQHDMNNIVISLRRVPEQSGDSDYVCNYDSAHGQIEYFPILAIPAKGIIRLGRSVKINEISNRTALLEKISSGGVAPITHKGFLPEVIDNGSVQYELNTDWGFRLQQEGMLKPQTYNFTLSFDVKYQLPAGKEQKLSFKVSSKIHESVRTGEVIQEPLLPLKIMWGCLSRDTLIAMADGTQKLISNIRIGDLVLGGLNKEINRVINAWTGPEEQLIAIHTENGGALKATPTHPIYMGNDSGPKIKQAANVMVGDRVLFFSGGKTQSSKVTQIEQIYYHDTVFNLSLENSSGFYANNFLVGDMEQQNREDF